MGYFESCSTMQTWQAWLFVFGAAFSCLLPSTIYNQVNLLLFQHNKRKSFVFFISIFIVSV